MIDYQEIGNNIKICRIRCNLKQAELAEMVGVTSQHISHVERCQTKPSLTLTPAPKRSLQQLWNASAFSSLIAASTRMAAMSFVRGQLLPTVLLVSLSLF